MRIIKKIGAFVCAAAISVSMVSVMPVGAYNYEACGHRTFTKNEMPNGWGKFAKNVKTNSFHGNYTAGELWILTACGKDYAQSQSKVSSRYCRDKNGYTYTMTHHQARVCSGGKYAETDYISASSIYPITTGTVKVKNGVATVESYYRYNKD